MNRLITIKNFFLLVLVGIVLFASWWIYEYKIGGTYAQTSELYQAVAENDIKTAQNLIDKGADINAERGFKTLKTILQKAIENGNVEMVSLLVKKGVSLEKPAEWASTPLDDSIKIAIGYNLSSYITDEVREHQKDIIRLLLSAHAPIHEFPKIFAAILADDLELVKKMLAEKELKAIKDQWKLSDALRAAVFSGDPAMIEYILNNFPVKADPSDMSGESLLEIALQSGNPTVVKYVLALPQTNIHARGADGITALHTAVQTMVSRPKKELVEMLLNKGADVNARANGGNTPLHDAISASRDTTEIIELLLQHGANVNAQNDAGITPLHVAVEWGRKKVVELLLSHGADKTIKNAEGKTPFEIKPMFK